MEKFDWKATIRINILMLKIVGQWPAGDETYKLNLYTLYAVISIVTLVVGHNFFQITNLFLIINDLSAVTSVIFVAFIQMVAIIKSYCFILNMKTVKELMVTLNSDMFQPKNARQRKLIQPSLDLWKRIYLTFWVSIIVTFFFWATFPILDKSFKEHRLPFAVWYPFNTKISPFYEMTYVYQLMCAYFIAVVNVSIDTFMSALNMYIGAQCDILCDDIRNLSNENDGSISISQRLTSCITHHQEILKFAANCNKCFNWIVLFQFFTSSISIGITMFQLTVVVPFSSEFYSLLFYGTAMAMEIFVYCWFGNEVEIKSTKIPYAIFESNWVEASEEIKKHMIYFTLRSQTPIKMSALNLFYLTVDTFVKILRTAWSYFAVLQQVNSSS